MVNCVVKNPKETISKWYSMFLCMKYFRQDQKLKTENVIHAQPGWYEFLCQWNREDLSKYISTTLSF